MFTLYQISFRADTKSFPVLYEEISDMWLSALEIGAAQLRFFTEIAPKWPFLYVNRSPIPYGFRAEVRAILSRVNIALIAFSVGTKS